GIRDRTVTGVQTCALPILVANVYSGAVRRIEAVDTVVLAAGSRSTDALYRALKGDVAELHAAGDCVAPRGVHQAILDGTRAARRSEERRVGKEWGSGRGAE